ncbi:VCBS repeat-containing protein [Fulvivirgaceae bacterium BMA12]|uniref:VCBS repeat-containing protein n=1 Tax=Agaribacillus aureus TaxID=3051825 RepID=A0ABT8LEK1_9BACT|nr:VCBS repeat-containing protein [Fulvivirgaceae bacterium BMA12]
MRFIYVLGIAIGLSMLFSNCKYEKNASEDLLFVKLAPTETGIDFINFNEENDRRNILTYEYFYNGGGVAVGDINNDGLTDIYFSANQGENKLYLNQGGFKFKDITQSAGIHAKSGWRTGVAMVDINGDGFLDIYVCRSGNAHPLLRENSFFINNKDLTFTDKSKELGLNDDSYSTQAAFLDFDRDGDLDVFLLNHSRLSISNSYDISKRYLKRRVKYVGNKFFRNDNGRFTDVSDTVGIFGHAANYGLGLAYADINGDGWLDLYVSNDYTSRDELLINKGGKGFYDGSDSLLTHMSQFTMGVDIADVNNDGWPDIVSLDMLPEKNERQKGFFWPDQFDVYNSMVANGLHHQYMRNMLHLNNGEGAFSEIGQLAGISNTDWSWAPLIADFDNDGLQDLFITNGFKRNFTDNDFLHFKSNLVMQAKQGQGPGKLSEVLELIPTNEAHNYIFRNENGMLFSDMSETWGFGEATLSNGAAYADFDNDGDLDIVVNNLGEEAGVYENTTAPVNHFLKVRLKGAGKNIFGVGASVSLYANGKSMMRILNPYRGFQSSVEPVLHFGLGPISNIDSLQVKWPDGNVQAIHSLAADQMIEIVQTNNRSEISAGLTGPYGKNYFSLIKGAIKFEHRENSFIDFNVQSMLPRMYSTQGPALAVGIVDGNGLEGVYIGGAKGHGGALFVRENEHYIQKGSFQESILSEEVDAAFFDADNDGDEDLYVVSGGYEYQPKDSLLQDRLYVNDGNGNFHARPLPPFYTSGSCVRPGDMDGDGDLDLFVGGRVMPGRYPEPPASHLLINDGYGRFSIQTDSLAPALQKLGMVTDAVWMDLNNDGKQDLIVVGEWMPITIFMNENGKLADKTNEYLNEKTAGWWNRILAADFDNDGDRDLVIGNFGMNNQFKPSPEKPVTMYYADYDNNGSVDPIMNYFIGNKSYPMPTRDELTRQSPMFKKRFTDYKSYTTATIEDMLTGDEIKKSRLLHAFQFKSGYFRNDGDRFVQMELPMELQIAPVFGLGAMDVNLDGHLDIIAAGNLSQIRARFGKATGNFGTVLLGDGNGGFTNLPSLHSGLKIMGDVRNLVINKDHMIVAVNNSQPQVYRISSGD